MSSDITEEKRYLPVRGPEPEDYICNILIILYKAL